LPLLNALLYYLVIIPVSTLPFFVLYRLSDGLYFLFYYVLGYRKKVVLANIRNSFPDKSREEHTQIAKRFYRHFCDLFVESLKVFTISKSSVLKRMKIRNPEVVDKYYSEGRSVIIAGGHYNNWELFAVAIDDLIKHHCIAIYKPLSNKFFDQKMRSTRGKYGLEMVSTKSIKSLFEQRAGELNAIIFGADQSPGNPRSAYWMEFLHQDTGVLFGTEKYAREFNLPVIYGRILKTRRGHYEFEVVLVCDDPSTMPYGAITEAHTRLLEKDINNDPAYWLWSHRRWKHKRPAPEQMLKAQ
jgi:KDO2-lipid IV(A) lauroyltransferase